MGVLDKSMAGHIAIFIPSLRGGGAERVMVTLANAFAARNISVDLILVKAEGPYLSELDNVVRIFDLNVSRVIAGLPGLVRYFRREHPQALLSAMSHTNVIALLAKCLAFSGTRVVVSERTQVSVSSAMSVLRRRRLLPMLMRWTYPWANGVVAVSHGVADDLSRTIAIPRERIVVIHNPIDFDRINSNSVERSAELYESVSSQSPIILGVGRLVEAKNFSFLIQAFAQTLKQFPAKLIILGEGPLRAKLEALIADNGLSNDVIMPGFVKNPYAWMRHAKIFVLSSSWEGFPNVLVEAMACGTAVISTDCPSGPKEILEDGKWGRLVPVDDVDALAKAMVETLNETEHPNVIERAREFSVDHAADQYLSVLRLAD